MNLTIVAATGGIGRQLVSQALGAGHRVTAVARRPRELPSDVRLVTADLSVAEPAALREAVAGADAVLSGLGARSAAEAGVAWRGTQALVQAMKAAGSRRLIVVSAAPIGTVASPARPNPPKRDPGDGFWMRHLLGPAIKTVLRKHYADLAQMEDVVRDSRLDWTIVRPPKLTDGALTRSYRTALGKNVLGGFSISRADVADLMLRSLSDTQTLQQTIGVAQ